MKTYLLISPQAWGKMYLSKHNYAIELADAGNQVYFLNPPTFGGISVKLQKDEKPFPNLIILSYTLPSYFHHLRFKARKLYDYLLHKKLITQVNRVSFYDEVWCFEPNLFSNLNVFAAHKKFLFIVDHHDNSNLKQLAKTADGIGTISQTILEYFHFSEKPKLLLNHGLNKTFAQLAENNLQQTGSNYKEGPIKVGYVGNLFQGERMDYHTLKEIILQNPAIEFHLYGPNDEKNNTLVSTLNDGLRQLIASLKNLPNVFLHGVLPQERLALEMQNMDAFLNCYNYKNDPSRSSNFHKIIEYLSTGKVTISNRILAYENSPGLLEMPDEYTNENLVNLFGKVISNLAHFNDQAKQQKRIRFALANTYKNHITTISRFLENAPLVVIE